MAQAPTITLAGLRALPPRILIPEAGRWLGMSRATAYMLAQRGEFPLPVVRQGQRYFILTSDLARHLGIDPRDLLES